jgi:cobalt-zinc-cadmium resistance protein CzcA
MHLVEGLINWALSSRLVVLLLAGAVAVVGYVCFLNINVEAYPDPAPAIVEVIAQWNGASAEEMERLVSIPLEVNLAGMPSLKATYSKSLFGLTHLRCIFNYGFPYKDARQEVINRLANLTVPVPPGVSPVISPASPIGEIYRYTLRTPKNSLGQEIYTLNDIKALEDFYIERHFRRVPRIIDISSFGGTVKRYEIQPDPERLKRHGITLAQLQTALTNSNGNVGGDFLMQGRTAQVVRCVGNLGGGRDPMEAAFGMKTPEEAAAYLRAEEQRRLQEIRDIVIVAINGNPIRIDDVVVGGPLPFRGAPSKQGVLVSHQTRLGMISQDRAMDPYQLTEQSLASLRADRVQETVLAKLGVLKEKDFETRELFLQELARVLDKDELRTCRDAALHRAVGLRYLLTDRALGALRSKEVPEETVAKLAPLKDKGFKSREQFVKALAAIPELDANVQALVLDESRIYWRHQDEKIQGVVLMRKGEQSLPSIEGVKKKVAELNTPGKLLPGVTLETYYDREDLVRLTTHTVTHNLVLGIVLVVVILMMFLSNIKTAVIVALNIPLALMFAFAVLYFRGESANLLSIGAVDFGIIVDSAVIMTENIFRNLSAGNFPELTLKERILKSTREIDKALFFSTAIMVVAFIPLFTMHGAEGQLFGPMSQTYAFALGGALFMALTLTPVLCYFLLKNVKPIPENLLVRFLKSRYLWQLKLCLRFPGTTCVVMACIIGITAAWPMMHLGREFMPELEEGSLWIRGLYPVNCSLETVEESIKKARKIMSSEKYPEISAVLCQMGRPDDGTDPGLFNCTETFVPLRPEGEWPVVERPGGQKKVRTRREIVEDMNDELKSKLPGIEWQFSQYIRDNVMEAISGVKADNCVKIFGPEMEKLEELAAKTKAEMSKIRGLHDLGIYRVMGQSNLEFAVDKEKCKRLGVMVADVNNVINSAVRGNACTQMVEGELTFDVTLRWPFDRRWDRNSIMEIPVDIINNNLTGGFQASTNQSTVVGGGQGPSASGSGNANPAWVSQNLSTYTALQPRLRVKDLVSPIGRADWRPEPDTVTVHKGTLTLAQPAEEYWDKLEAGKTYVFTMTSVAFDPKKHHGGPPALQLWNKKGELLGPKNGQVFQPDEKPARPPGDQAGRPDPRQDLEAELSYTPKEEGYFRLVASSSGPLEPKKDLPYTLTIRKLGGDFTRPAGSIITREEGKRFIAVKFAVRGDRDLASVVHEVREKTANLFQPPYYISMGGEFEQMEDGEKRLLIYIPASLALIFLLLYVAFRSLLDAVVILSNVFDLAVGGIWALYLTGTNFSMSAAVGFVSLFGVAIMEGLLMISYFNALRTQGLELQDAIVQGALKRVRPVMITALTAILGLLPAALSTSIGSQTQRPLAIVVVGGMIMTLFLDRYLMPVLYSFYGHRAPPEAGVNMAHD